MPSSFSISSSAAIQRAEVLNLARPHSEQHLAVFVFHDHQELPIAEDLRLEKMQAIFSTARAAQWQSALQEVKPAARQRQQRQRSRLPTAGYPSALPGANSADGARGVSVVSGERLLVAASCGVVCAASGAARSTPALTVSAMQLSSHESSPINCVILMPKFSSTTTTSPRPINFSFT